jgi:uncharacterized protein YkwD
MRATALISAMGLGLVFLSATPQPARAGGLEDGVLEELNFARTRPADYARQVLLRRPVHNPDARFASVHDQDPEAVDEAIAFLMRQQPLPPLRPDDRLAAAARDHAAAQGPQGGRGHSGPGGEGPGQRMQRRGVWAGLSAENISYGYETPREVVLQLIVDSGVPNRGHRNTIFSRGYQAAGVACGRHRVYSAMCVIDFAGAVVAR